MGPLPARNARRMVQPTPRRPGKPYRVLYSLLYSRFVWAERSPDQTIRANAAQYAQALGLRTQSFHAALAALAEMGELERFEWRKGWFVARPRCPEGCVRLVGPDLRGHEGPRPLGGLPND